MTEWRAVRPGDSVNDTDLYDMTFTDTVNRWARSAELKFDDSGGDKKADYPRGERVELEYSTDGGSSWTRRFAGFVQTTTEKSEGGASIVETKVVGYDHLLRRRQVYKSYSSSSVSTSLNDLITGFTSVNWVAGNVTVANDKTITIEFKGERVDEAIDLLASISGNEDYGVNNDLEFFFEQRSTTEAGKDILDGDWTTYDLPEEGKRSINRIRLFYGSGGSESSVIVEDRNEQLSLKNDLNAPRRVVISESFTYPNIANEDAAQDKAQQILNRRSTIQTGEVETFDRFEVDAGDVFRLQISEKNIDSEFRVAQIEYDWRRDRTTVTVAENEGDIEDLLVSLADDVNRISARDADPDASFTRFLNLPCRAEITESVTVQTTSTNPSRFKMGLNASTTLGLDPDDSSTSRAGLGISKDATTITQQSGVVTNAGLNAARDVWQGESAPALDVIAVGDGETEASTTDTALQNQLKEASQTDNDSGSKGITFDATISTTSLTTISELGLLTTGDDLLYRATFVPTDVSNADNVSISIEWTWQDDTDTRGVVTDNGQGVWRDLFRGNNSAPSDMAIGTGTASPSTSDTSLGTKLEENNITNTADSGVGETSVVARWGTGEVNGNDVAEIGEENTNNTLLTRQTFEPLSKTSDFALEVNHATEIGNA